MAHIRRLTDLLLAPYRDRRENGQALVLFVLVAVALIGSVAIVTDVSWLWVNQQRMQRAADAAALAGAIYLPGDPSTAYSVARAEAVKNGYTNGSGGVVVTPLQDSANRRRLNVNITGPVGTYFARVFCYDAGACLESVSVGATGRAEYVLPVPMGSPENYYGVGFFVDAVVTSTSALISGDTGWRPTALAVSGGRWNNPTNAYTNNTTYTTESTTTDWQIWNTFGLLGGSTPPPNDPSLEVRGLELRLTNISLIGSGTASSCQVRAEVTWDAGTTWSSVVSTIPLNTTASADQTLGSATSVSAWGSHVWTRNDLTDSNFRVRLTWTDGVTGCPATRDVQLDQLEARVSWRWNQVTTTTTYDRVDVVAPNGAVLARQNFWGAMQSQGAPNIQGDAHMTKYNPRTSGINALYDPDAYYNYAVEMPAGSTGGEVWIFDAGFCDGSTPRGTGENWTVGGSNGNATREPVSAYFDLWDTTNTPYDSGDDTLIASSGDTYERLNLSDHQLGVTTGTDCASMSWHHGWWRLANGLSGGSKGRVYRLHTYSTDPSSANDQNSSTGLNAFAFWATASGGVPRIYGIGAMEAYVKLPGGTTSEFYLAQIEQAHAGKTLQIDLWDPGDTASLSANLQILQPTATSYQPVAFSYTARQDASGASACNARTGTNVTSVTTNTGGTSLYNGCWLTITILLPNGYDAPHPSSDTVTNEGGWWKVRYIMGGTYDPTCAGSSCATDLTTWEVSVRGSPVHLVVP